MNKWLLLLVTALVGGIGGYLIGQTGGRDAAETSSTQSGSASGPGLLGGTSAEGAGSSDASGWARGGRAPGGMNVNVLRRELETIKRDPNPIKRFASLTQLLGKLDPDTLPDILQAFDEIPMRQEHREEYQMLMYAWASFDPEGALKFVDENANSRSLQRGALLKPILSSWASNDPDKALEWMDSLPESERGEHLSGLIEGWATKDAYAAASYLQEKVEPGQQREALAGDIASHLFKQDPMGAARWAEAQEDPQFRSEAFEELAEDWASVDPKGLADWLGQHMDEEYSLEAVEDLARAWVSQDPDAATGYFESLEDGAAKERGIYEMARTWGKDDLTALGEWLNGLGDSDVTDLGVKAYVERLAGQSPEAAITSAMSIGTDAMRDEAVQNVGRQWFRQDPEAATAWAQANNVPVESFHQPTRRTVDGAIFQAEGGLSGAAVGGILGAEISNGGAIDLPAEVHERMLQRAIDSGDMSAEAAELLEQHLHNQVPPAE